jgi:hypothetical protein
MFVTPRYGQRRKRYSSIAVQLLLSESMTYYIVLCAAICPDCAENTIPLLLFTSRCLVKAGCCDSTILALSEYATGVYIGIR